MRVPEGADFLGVCRSTIYKYMDSGKLPFVKIGRSRRIPRKALVELAAEHLSTEQAV